MARKRKVQLLVSFILCGLTIVLQLTARTVDGFGQWYAVHIYPFFVHTVGRICSIVPFSAAEFVLYGLILYLLCRIGFCVFMACKEKRFEKERWIGLLCFVFTAVSIGLCIFTLTCGINYFRIPFSEASGFSIKKHSTEELRELCISLAEEMNEASDKLERDENGMVVICDNIHEEVNRAMKNLGEKYPVLSGYYPRPKPVTFSSVLTYQYIMGIYSPFTLEANYNRDMPDFELPYSICHELSHLKGFMREDEAGFIAYLACHYSDNPMLNYSGAMEAFSYAIGDYYMTAGYEAYHQIYDMLEEEVRAEQYASDQWWESHRTVVQTISDQLNDAYLRANDQEDGTQSYGRMVDLLLEEFLRNRNTDDR